MYGYFGEEVVMEVKQLLGAIVAMIAKIAVAAVVIVVVFKLAVSAYGFGYDVFADLPVSEGEGKVVSFVVEQGQGSKEISELLEKKGLIKNADVFYIQEQLSDYKGKIQPGVYELSTSMNTAQMIAVICGVTEE